MSSCFGCLASINIAIVYLPHKKYVSSQLLSFYNCISSNTVVNDLIFSYIKQPNFSLLFKKIGIIATGG